MRKGFVTRLREGKPLPLGAEISRTPEGEDGVNFSIFSRNATGLSLVLFADESEESPRVEFPLDAAHNRTGDLWHCFVPGLGAGALYLWRADGPWQPAKGHRFNREALLLDPYAKAVTHVEKWKKNGPRCVVVDDDFDWQGDKPLNYPLRKSILYEAHVRGFTQGKDSGAAHPGTYLGLVEKIPYLRDLGITSLELLPLQAFNPGEVSNLNPKTGKLLSNYWGYSTAAFFAPHTGYGSDKSPGAAVREFKTMTRELHKAGLEVILDVVFNHTAEGNEKGPTISFRGLDNAVYYMLEDDRRYYRNYSGCGNTVNCNNPVMRTFIIDCLRYWVVEMHVDGFRFDLGSILGRDQKGRLMENPPVIERIAEDPILRNTKLIAEAWDAGGAYQVGWFPGGRWAEWNDRYRDDVRRFWNLNAPDKTVGNGRGANPGVKHAVRNLATRLAGSSDLYLRDGRKPFHSVNFVTCHDGFTLADLVSYKFKHNEENGEKNNDGAAANLSRNYGFEGRVVNPAIEKVREQQMKNFIATLLLSQGAPMLLGGDEFARTQNGSNNAYCQDNETSWYDWSLLKNHAGLYRFVKKFAAFRLRHMAFQRPEFYTGRDGDYNGTPDISWYNPAGKQVDWEGATDCLALRMEGTKAEILADRDDNDFFIMFNAGARDVVFTVPFTLGGRRWYRAVDTSLPSPDDICDAGKEPPVVQKDKMAECRYTARARSVVVLLAKI
jgi:glycogen operon protein